MNEQTIADKYIAANDQFNSDDGGVAKRFIEDHQDRLIVKVNAIISKREGLFRSRQALRDVAYRIESFIALYREYKKGKINGEEFRQEREKKIEDWINCLTSQFYNSVIYESGTSSQYLQLLRGLGFLTDHCIDISNFDDGSPVIKIIDWMLDALKRMGINLVDLGINENSDNNTIFKKLMILQLKLNEVRRIIHKKQQQKDYELSEEEKFLKRIGETLLWDLHLFTEEYSRNVLKVPAGVSLFLVLTRVRSELQEVEEEINEIDDLYWVLTEKAQERGYKKNNLDRYQMS